MKGVGSGWLRLVVLLLLLGVSSWVSAAAPALDAITMTTNPNGEQTYSLSIQLLLLMTLFTFIPALVMLMTSFTRILIVLAILRQAIGLNQAPSSQVLIALSLFLTFFIMAPVYDEIRITAVEPYFEEQIGFKAALEKGALPLRQFMLNQTRETSLALFASLAGQEDGFESEAEIPLTVLIPAFATSELKTAFQIGFLIFIPFLIIDLVVASVLMAMGMMMLSPMIISLPFKIMLFVLVDGWNLIIGTLASSFYL